MNFKRYKTSAPAYGFHISRDCHLQQWEPYEVVDHWEPQIIFYFRHWMFKISVNVPPHSRLGRYYGKQREAQKWI